MLNVFRKKAQSTLIQGLVLMIAVVFVFWGVGSNMNKNRNSVATVNGEEISLKDFQRSYDRAVENMRNQFGGQIPPGLLEKMGIKQQVLGQLVQTELFRQGGKKMGITVSDLAVQKVVEKTPVFQKDGHFDLAFYKRVLSQNRLTPKSYENGLKADLLTQRVTGAIGSFTVVPDAAVNSFQAYSDEEIKLAFVTFNPVDFEDKVSVQEEELSAWFEKNKEKFRSDPQIRLKYLFFGFDEDAAGITLSDEDLRKQYEAEKSTFTTPEKRHARHILFKVTENDSEAVKAEKKKEAEKVLALAKQGKDFAKLAQEYSEGPTRERGGDLGIFSRGRMVPSFDDAVFTLKTGEVSDLVQTRFGYHIIKVEEIFPASTRSFDVVKDNLASSMKKQRARGLTFTRGTTAYEGIMRAGSLEKYGQLNHETIAETDFFTRSTPPKDVPADKKFLEKAFSLNQGELSSLIELPDGYAIIFVDERKTPALPTLADVREKAVAGFTKEKAVDLARKAADDFLALSREKKGIEGAAEGVKVTTTPFLKRSASAGKDLPPAQVIQEGFTLPWKEKVAKKSLKVGKVFYVYEVADRRLNSEGIDDARKKQIRERLLASSRRVLIQSWLTGMQEKAKIWTNDSFLK
ncbi:MAG: hypothetical protein DSY58_01065 [Desulfobulbus sp.]|nr:MAG: hypothetical protein DSY58_01065 [Desulfobulbus sp.]